MRNGVGVLDMSLMAKLSVQGPAAAAVLGRLSANDIDFFLMGKSEVDRSPAVRGETAALRPFTGHMLDLPRGGSHVALQ